MNYVTIYRAFRTRCHAVYEREISSQAVISLTTAQTPYLLWMVHWVVPTIFTKPCMPYLSAELSHLLYDGTLNDLSIVLEAYPSSYHHAPVQETGVIISLNGQFEIGKSENQRNWKYTEAFVVEPGHVDRRLPKRTLYKLKDLPKPPGRTKFSPKPPSVVPPLS